MASIHFYGHPQHPAVAQWAINTDCVPKALHATGLLCIPRNLLCCKTLLQINSNTIIQLYIAKAMNKQAQNYRAIIGIDYCINPLALVWVDTFLYW